MQSKILYGSKEKKERKIESLYNEKHDTKIHQEQIKQNHKKTLHEKHKIRQNQNIMMCEDISGKFEKKKKGIFRIKKKISQNNNM